MEDLAGKTWAYPDAGSTSGYLAILPMISEAGIETGETLEAGGHTGAVRAVYNGEADFATTFFSPPLKPEGEEAWKPGDEPEIPAELIEECAPNEDGSKLMCGEWRVLDARASMREEAPDMIQKVRILTISPPIPNDTLSFSPDFPDELRDRDRRGTGRLRRDRGLGCVHRQPGLLRLDRHQPGRGRGIRLRARHDRGRRVDVGEFGRIGRMRDVGL